MPEMFAEEGWGDGSARQHTRSLPLSLKKCRNAAARATALLWTECEGSFVSAPSRDPSATAMAASAEQ